jgi:hypothetical protein
MAMTNNDGLSSGYVTGEYREERVGTPAYRPVEAGSPPYVPAIPESRPASADQASTVEVAKDQAASVASGAADAAQDVAGVAKEQAGQVAAEAGRQIKDLLDHAQTELADQAAQQQKRVASGLRDLGDQFQAMAKGAPDDGVAVDLAREAAVRTHRVAGWLEVREPGSVLAELRSFARQRPGVFLAVAVGAGVVAGRLARGLTADPQTSTSSNRSPVSPEYAPGMAAPSIGVRPEPGALGQVPPTASAGQDAFLTGTAETLPARSWSDPALSAAEGHQ